MGARGPQRGKAYGAAALAKVFKDVTFPLSKHDIMQKYGEKEIEYTKGSPIKLREVIWNMNDDTFNSPADLEHALHEELTR